MLSSMPFHSRRVIEPELLDEQPPGAGRNSLSDLVRINRIYGGHGVLRKLLKNLVSPNQSFTILDVGAASGDAAGVIRRLYPNARVLSLDYRLHHLRSAPGDRVVADAFALPLGPRTFDIVYCGLFLHHFPDAAVTGLLRSFSSLAREYVVVNDLERHWIPYHALPLTSWLFRWDPLTLHDGPVSVQAAFEAGELRTLAERADLRDVHVRTHRPSFRLSLVAKPRHEAQ